MKDCKKCKHYSKEENNCKAFRCDPFHCSDPLPCEETDALTLYVTRGVGDEETDYDLIDFDDCGSG